MLILCYVHFTFILRSCHKREINVKRINVYVEINQHQQTNKQTNKQHKQHKQHKQTNKQTNITNKQTNNTNNQHQQTNKQTNQHNTTQHNTTQTNKQTTINTTQHNTTQTNKQHNTTQTSKQTNTQKEEHHCSIALFYHHFHHLHWLKGEIEVIWLYWLIDWLNRDQISLRNNNSNNNNWTIHKTAISPQLIHSPRWTTLIRGWVNSTNEYPAKWKDGWARSLHQDCQAFILGTRDISDSFLGLETPLVCRSIWLILRMRMKTNLSVIWHCVTMIVMIIDSNCNWMNEMWWCNSAQNRDGG